MKCPFKDFARTRRLFRATHRQEKETIFSLQVGNKNDLQQASDYG